MHACGVINLHSVLGSEVLLVTSLVAVMVTGKELSGTIPVRLVLGMVATTRPSVMDTPDSSGVKVRTSTPFIVTV